MSLARLKSLQSYNGKIVGKKIYRAKRYGIVEFIATRTNQYHIYGMIDGVNIMTDKNVCFFTYEEAELKMLKINIEAIRDGNVVSFANKLKEITDKYAEHLI